MHRKHLRLENQALRDQVQLKELLSGILLMLAAGSTGGDYQTKNLLTTSVADIVLWPCSSSPT